jgi:hypothetical protein
MFISASFPDQRELSRVSFSSVVVPILGIKISLYFILIF